MYIQPVRVYTDMYTEQMCRCIHLQHLEAPYFFGNRSVCGQEGHGSRSLESSGRGSSSQASGFPGGREPEAWLLAFFCRFLGAYLDPNSMENQVLSPCIWGLWAIIIHVFGVQVGFRFRL